MSETTQRIANHAAEYAAKVWPDLRTPAPTESDLERAELRAERYSNAHVEGEHAVHGCPFTSTECGERAAAAEYVECTNSTPAPKVLAEQAEATESIVLEISVPSGKIIATDNLRSVGHFNIEPPLSINDRAGLDAWAQLLAEQANTAYAFVGNSCPTVIRQAGGSLEVISPDWGEDSDAPVLNDGETAVAEICTDLWATMLTDYRNWLEHGGPEIAVANERFAIEPFTLIEVTPGKYRWTVYSHDDRFDIHAEGRVTYARLERIETY